LRIDSHRSCTAWPVVAALDRHREGEVDVPAGEQDTDADLGRFQSPGMDLAQRFADREGEGHGGQADGDGRRGVLGDVVEEPLGLQDAQRLAHGTALDAELLGEPGLGGHAPAGTQFPGPDPGAQLVGHLAMCPLWPL
jgi:hypothetical protein